MNHKYISITCDDDYTVILQADQLNDLIEQFKNANLFIFTREGAVNKRVISEIVFLDGLGQKIESKVFDSCKVRIKNFQDNPEFDPTLFPFKRRVRV